METQNTMLEKLIAKTEEDPDFRQRLLDNPRSGVKEALDIEVPDAFDIVIHEDDAHTAHLVLPPSAELSDAQLEQAAGGTQRCLQLQWLT